MPTSRVASRSTASLLGLSVSLLLGSNVLASAGATTPLPLDRMPLDAARYCNRACPVSSCSVVCRLADDCASVCTRRGVPVCRCLHGKQT